MVAHYKSLKGTRVGTLRYKNLRDSAVTACQGGQIYFQTTDNGVRDFLDGNGIRGRFVSNQDCKENLFTAFWYLTGLDRLVYSQDGGNVHNGNGSLRLGLYWISVVVYTMGCGGAGFAVTLEPCDVPGKATGVALPWVEKLWYGAVASF